MFLINEEEEDGNLGTGRSPRKFWSVVDDSHLIISWLNTSKTGQRHRWDRITAYMNENHPLKDGPRNIKSCKNRWATISKFVTKFVNAVAQARERATSDMSESDVLILANQLYRDDVKIDFHMSHAYELLKNEPKFLDAYITKEKPDMYISAQKQDICELQPNIDDELSFSEAGESSKRSRLNEGVDYLSANNGDDPCTPQVKTRSLDPCTPQVQTNREVEPMPSVGSLGEQIRSSLQVFRETNKKVDEWKEVKLREMQINAELKVKKMEQKNRDNKYKLFNTLLGKASLSEFDEALKNKLYAELFPE